MKYADLLRSLSGFNGLSQSGRHIEVRQHDEGNILYNETPSKLTITVPSLTDADIPDQQAQGIRSQLGRIVAQFLYSEGVHSTIDEWKCDESPLGGIVRDVDSLRAGSQLGQDFAGIRSAMRESASKGLAEFSGKVDAVPKDLDGEGAAALGGYVAAEVAKAMSHGVPVSEINALTSKLPSETQDKIKGAIDEGLLSRCINAQSQDESIKAGQDLFEYFFNRSAEEEIQQQQQKAAEGEGDGGDGDGDQDGEGQGAGTVAKALGKEGKGEEGDEGGQGASGEWGRSEKDGEPHEDGEIPAIGDDGYGHYFVTPPQDVVMYDYASPQHRDKRARRFAQDDVLKNDGALLATVRRLLQTRSESTYIGEQKRGKLQRSKVYRVGCPTVGNGDWNSRVWRKRIDSETLDTAVEVLIDFSGSMAHGPIEAAIQSSVKLARCLDKVGIPCAVTSFSESSQHGAVLVTGYFKDYDAPCRPQDMLDSMWHHCKNHLHQNPDCCGVHYAIERMARRKEKRKVLLVMSDGYPASWRKGNQSELLPQIVKGAGQQGVECYGIGIMSDSVAQFYPEYTILNSEREITSCLTKIIKQKIV
ncbi:MAG: putative peptidase [Prokaryotic dsDNA virus sp.]|nr:MAG: putative peptidase [Prokaryotic dsDNA virus sp.]